MTKTLVTKVEDVLCTLKPVPAEELFDALLIIVLTLGHRCFGSRGLGERLYTLGASYEADADKEIARRS
jgi:hypothetical protein